MNRSIASRPIVALLLGFFVLSTPVMAQRYKVEVDKPDFDDLQSPEVGGNTGKKNFNQRTGWRLR